ncbi:MAG: rhomboid family intramembrane serine protease [Verrucomicrobiota bacterium]
MASSNKELVQGIPQDFEAPEGLVPLAVFEDFQAASEAGLAILAMGNPYWTYLYDDAYIICVSDQVAAIALHELMEVASLKAKQAQTGRIHLPEYQVAPWSFVVFSTVLIGVFTWQSRAPILDLGRVDSVAMLASGQWWRAITALTLHADIVHLVSNLVGGMGFAFLLSRFFGASLAWLLILLSGLSGNLINAWLHYPDLHLSIGASTGVFGALGLLTGVGVWYALANAGASRSRQTPQWLLPAFGGFTLLGMLGTGGSHIDVAAHISGFVCGCVFGILGAVFHLFIERLEKGRFVLSGLSLAIVFGAWGAALSSDL